MAKSQRRIDDNGFMLVKGCPISSYGIFQYSAGQINLPGDPNRIVNVYRPESAVSDPETIESLKNIPLINEHTMLSGFSDDQESTAPEDKGVDGVLTGDVYYEAPWLRGDVKAFSRSLQSDLEAGKADLSLGYACRYTEQPGVFEGVAYEVIQDRIRGNHLALVTRGRVPGARVLDGLCFDHLSFDFQPSKEETDMPDPTNKETQDASSASDPVARLRALWPQLSTAVEGFLGQEAKEPEHQEQAGQAAQVDNEEEAANAAAAEAAAAAAEAAAANAEAGEAGQEAGGAAASEASAASMPEGTAELISQIEAILAELKGTTANDNVTGLQEQTTLSGAQTSTDDDGNKGQDNSSEAPPVVQQNAQDSAIRAFYRDADVKDRLYDRLSSVVGAFSHRGMDSAQVAEYGVKKLGLKCEKGAEFAAVDNYLNGVEAGRKAITARKQTAQDSAGAGCAELDAWLQGEK